MGRASKTASVLVAWAVISACRAGARAPSSCPPASPASAVTTPSRTGAPVVITGAILGPEEVLRPTVERQTLLARARTWSLALDPESVFYGDGDANLLLSIPKLGGPSVTIGEGAPWDVVVASRRVVWIGAPGDVVLAQTLPPSSQAPDVLRRGGRYVSVAAIDEDVYVAEAQGDAGSLVHVARDGRVKTLGKLQAQPRALAVDASHVYVLTARAIERLPRRGGRLERVTTGFDLSRLAVDDDYVYATDIVGPSRALTRVSKRGGVLTVIQHAVRDAPFALFGLEAFYFDKDQPTLRRVGKSGGASLIVARSPPLLRATALAVDESGIFVGTEIAGGGGVLALALPRP